MGILKFFSKRKLTGADMIRLEHKVKESPFQNLNCKHIEQIYSLAEKFKLDIDAPVDKKHRAALVAPTKEGYNGLILLRDKDNPNRFDLIHEMVHYVFDVGVGNVVTNSFYEDYSENRESDNEDEREVNYMTAAIIMPFAEIERKLKDYFESDQKTDLMAFITSLQTDYSVSRGSVQMRIQEVRKQVLMRNAE